MCQVSWLPYAGGGGGGGGGKINYEVLIGVDLKEWRNYEV